MVNVIDRAREQASRADTRALLGRDSVYVLAWTVQLLVASGSTPLLTRLLPDRDFGRVAAANAVMQVVFVLGGFALATALQRAHASSGATDARRLFSVSMAFAALVCSLTAATGVIWAPLVGFASFTGPPCLGVIWAACSIPTNTGLALLRSQDRLLPFLLTSLAQSVAAEAVGITLLLARGSSAENYLLGQVVAQAAALALAVGFGKPARVGSSALPMIKRSLRFSAPLVPALLSTLALASADRLIVQRLLGATQLGQYQILYNVCSMPIIVLDVLNTVWLPRFFAAKEADAAELLRSSRNILLLLLAPVIAGMAVGAPLVLALWAPSSYRVINLKAAGLLIVLSAIPYASAQHQTRILMKGGNTGGVAVANLSGAVTNLLFNFLLVPILRLTGAAAATLVGYGLLALLLRVFARRELSHDSVPTRVILVVLVGSLVGCSSLLLSTDGVGLLVRGALGVACLLWMASTYLCQRAKLQLVSK